MLLVLVYMLFVFFVLKIDDPNIGVAPISILFIIGITGATIWAFVNLFSKLRRLRRIMKKFALGNGFTFAQPKMEAVDPEFIPPSSILMPKHTFMRYLVTGRTEKGVFELYSLWGETEHSTSEQPAMAYVTVLRTRFKAQTRAGDDFVAVNQGQYGYVTFSGNIFDRERIQKLFSYISA